MNRRRLILSAAGAGLAVSRARRTRAASRLCRDRRRARLRELRPGDRVPAQGLLREGDGREGRARRRRPRARPRRLQRGRARDRARRSSSTDAGQTAARRGGLRVRLAEGRFASAESTAATGLEVTQPLLGAYISAAATISIPSYRTLFASMAANVAQQVGALSRAVGRPRRRRLVPARDRRGDRKRRDRGLPWLGDNA